MRVLDTVVGGLYGSEAKGHATAKLVERRLAEGHWVTNTRVGGPNAGHTGYDAVGRKWALRQVPIGVVHGQDPKLRLEIAPGSEIDPEVMLGEIDSLYDHGLMKAGQLLVSGEATVISFKHKEAETMMVGKIGSTGKGIGAARADRLMRTAQRVRDVPELVYELESRGVFVPWNYHSWDHTVKVIEGTQGYALGLHAGHYPQCTSGNCRAIDFMSQAGVNPWQYEQNNVWVVGRVYPIRVAGNSGYMTKETSWAELGLPEEKTTVTQKVRRVGMEDWALMRQAVAANGPKDVKIALAMVDHKFPEVAGVVYSPDSPEWVEAEAWLKELELDAPVELVMSGPDTAGWRNP